MTDLKFEKPLVNYNVYWPIIGHLNCMTSYLRFEKLREIMERFSTGEIYLIENVRIVLTVSYFA